MADGKEPGFGKIGVFFGDAFKSDRISSIRAYFGKRTGSGSGQVAQNRELKSFFFAISNFWSF